MADEPAVIELRDVSKEYPAAEPLRVLNHADFALDAGGCAAIVGPSGCGKSTLLNLMGALDTPTTGRVLFRGGDLAERDAGALARFRNREVGFVFQAHHLLPQCTVLENVLIPTLAHREGVPGALARATELLERVHLAHRIHARPEQLSGGERQRTAFVRALINRPALLLADEPTGSLNEEAAMELADLMIELQRDETMAVVVVTHAWAIAERFGRILELRNGRLESRN